jgi:hypothetical protein
MYTPVLSFSRAPHRTQVAVFPTSLSGTYPLSIACWALNSAFASALTSNFGALGFGFFAVAAFLGT